MSDKRNKWIKPAVLSIVLLGASGLGIAAAKSGGWGHGACADRHGGHMSSSISAPGRHLEGKLAFLNTELKITEDQESAWQAFAEVVRKQQAERIEKRTTRRKAMREQDGSRIERRTLDERIDRRLEAMEERLVGMREMAEAAKTLYGQLTPEQQEIADALMPGSRHQRGHRSEHRHGHGHDQGQRYGS